VFSGCEQKPITEYKVARKLNIDKSILLSLGIFYILLFSGLVVFYIADPFENKCIEGNCVNGHGIYIYHSGLKYEGEWKNGLRSGNGTLTYPDSYTYEGEFKKNRMDGYGTKVMIYFKYAGEWKNGSKYGKQEQP